MSFDAAWNRARQMERRNAEFARLTPQQQKKFLEDERLLDKDLEEIEAEIWRDVRDIAKPLFLKLAKGVGWSLVTGIIADEAREPLEGLFKKRS